LLSDGWWAAVHFVASTSLISPSLAAAASDGLWQILINQSLT